MALHEARPHDVRPELLSTDLAASWYFSGEDPESLRRRIRANQIPSDIVLRIGRTIFLRRRALEEWLGVSPSPRAGRGS